MLWQNTDPDLDPSLRRGKIAGSWSAQKPLWIRNRAIWALAPWSAIVNCARKYQFTVKKLDLT
jgi:hypothetical protein